MDQWMPRRKFPIVAWLLILAGYFLTDLSWPGEGPVLWTVVAIAAVAFRRRWFFQDA